METLAELKKRLFSDGELSTSDIEQLKEAMFDGGMTMGKGEFLFDLKDSVNHKKVAVEFKQLFVDAISALLLEDEESPGEIDDSEAKWLRAKIQSTGELDDFDKALLKNLKERAINYPSILNYKHSITRKFEKCLYFSRYLTLLAVFGSLLAAIALFVKGSIIVFDALVEFFHTFNTPEYESMLEMFVSSVDVFLFGMVLVIFGVGIYELFITKIDPVLQKVDGRPSWMQISNVDDLKSSLGKVILMVLIVTFFKHSIEVEYGNVNELLKLGFGIVLIALALFITSKSHHN
ncbi:MAG: YqhA family protein [Bacteroides sp.]|nr:YqhA family protein [Bacteroides sp.]MBD5350419.1 YqhA family protein [Bacteroides sp.]